MPNITARLRRSRSIARSSLRKTVRITSNRIGTVLDVGRRSRRLAVDRREWLRRFAIRRDIHRETAKRRRGVRGGAVVFGCAVREGEERVPQRLRSRQRAQLGDWPFCEYAPLTDDADPV